MEYRRVLVLVNKKFQLGLTFYILAMFLLQNIFLIGAIYLWSGGIFELISNDEIAHQVSTYRYQLIFFLILYSLISLAIVYVIMIFKTHKIAGPIYKLILTLKNSKEKGVVQKLTFRDGDYFDEIPKVYNETIEGFINNQTLEEK